MVKKSENKQVENKTIEETIESIQSRFGAGSLMRLDSDFHLDIESIPTGSLKIDSILGIGGFPKGRVSEIYGGPACGKTTLALHLIQEAQKCGGIAAIVDTEHALDKKYAERLGVNLHDLLIAQPNTAEEALQIVEQLVRDGNVSVVVLDSVAALLPRAESVGDIGETQIGLQARLMSSSLRKLVGLISRSQVCAIFINQTRAAINTGPFSYGPSTTTSGGNALSFYASVRIEMKRMQQIKQGEEVIGVRTKVKTVKNKVAAPFKECEVDVYYGEGISKGYEILEVGTSLGIIEQKGSFFYYKGDSVGHGQKSAKEWLINNETVCQEIRDAVSNKKEI